LLGSITPGLVSFPDFERRDPFLSCEQVFEWFEDRRETSEDGHIGSGREEPRVDGSWSTTDKKVPRLDKLPSFNFRGEVKDDESFDGLGP